MLKLCMFCNQLFNKKRLRTTKLMLAIIDARAPRAAIDRLGHEFETVLFSSTGETYGEVSGHPDIFLFQHENTIVAASNTPVPILDALQSRYSTRLIISQCAAGVTLAQSSYFNCSATASFWFHKQGSSAPEIASLMGDKIFVALPQAYARCTTAAVTDSCIISSDAGVCKSMRRAGLAPLYVEPSGILLPGFKYGFLGGACGWTGNKIYFIGNIFAHAWGEELQAYLQCAGIESVCLSEGRLYDGGGIFFVE